MIIPLTATVRGMTGSVLLALAGVAAIGAAGLWCADVRGKRGRGDQEGLSDATDAVQAQDVLPTAVQQPAPAQDVLVEDVDSPAPDVPVVEHRLVPDAGGEDAQEPDAQEPEAQAADHATAAEATGQDSAAQAPARKEAAGETHLPAGLPGAERRRRRKWAEANGYDFAKTDPYLVQEWERVPGAAAEHAKDVVNGVAEGYEFYLADCEGTALLALRLATTSAAVVELHRHRLPEPDLLPVPFPGEQDTAPKEGRWWVYSTDVTAVGRLLDERMVAVVAAIPAGVDDVWIESGWVVAAPERREGPALWEALIRALVPVADIMHALPPTGGVVFDPAAGDPSRPLVLAPPEPDYLGVDAAPTTGPQQAAAEAGQGPAAAPPSRAVPQVYGSPALRPVGGDEVDAIASSLDPSPSDGTRIVRNLPVDSTIFHDGSDTGGAAAAGRGQDTGRDS